jgi:uracil-DNA glycosylase family 4
LKTLNRRIAACRRCPRLCAYRHEIARRKRRAFVDWEYWGKPVPNFGPSPAPLLVVGLAPAAHGANRTGRMFTGDESGRWLFRALYKAGFANQAESTNAGDGLKLIDCAITAVCHCAPPANKPTRDELDHCRQWLRQTLNAVRPRVLLALGQIAWTQLLPELIRRRWLTPPRPWFGHLACVSLAGGRSLVGSYHPSQQNTFTGRLTQPMLDAAIRRARELCGLAANSAGGDCEEGC